MRISIATTLKEGVVVGKCSMPGNSYDAHPLIGILEQAATLAVMTRSQAMEILGKAMIKGALGDALHAVMCGAGHNLA